MKFLLCDANVIIEAFGSNIWKLLASRFKIFMSSVVLDESRYFKDDLCQKHFLDFKNNIDNGMVTIVATTTEDVQHILEKAIKNGFDIHTGEAESLSAMLKSEYSELYFCTADRRAVIVAHLFGLLDRVISLEKCLGKNAIHLPPKLTEKVMRKWKAEAIQRGGIT